MKMPWDNRPWYRRWGFNEWFALTIAIVVPLCTAITYWQTGDLT